MIIPNIKKGLYNMKAIIDFIEFEGWIVKVFLLFLFIANIAISGLSTLSKSSYPATHNGKNIQEREIEVNRFCFMLVDEAKKNPEYCPENYFQDLIRAQKKEKELKVPSLFSGFEMELQRCTTNSFAVKCTEAYYKAFENAARKHRAYLEELKRKESIKKSNYDWATFLKKAFKVYLIYMPFAFLYFLILIIEGNQKERVEFYPLNLLPLSFSLLFYPIVLLILFIRFVKKSAIKIQYSRTRKYLFTPFSGDELKAIKQLASEISWREIFVYFPKQGISYQHSFVIAFIAVIVISVLPHKNHVGVMEINYFSIAIEQSQIGTRDGPSINNDHNGIDHVPWFLAILPYTHSLIYVPTITILHFKRFYTLFGFRKAPEHIPELTPCFYDLFKKIKSKFKEIEDEKNIFGNMFSVFCIQYFGWSCR